MTAAARAHTTPALSDHQQNALAMISFWLKAEHSPFFYLGGYAGTGKTTIARQVEGMVDGKVAYVAFTGKAALNMRKAGCKGARTIHSLIYATDLLNGKTTVTLIPGALDGFKLVVVDECSMVNDEIAKDLLSFGVPILALGDPAQLPPVSGPGFFSRSAPNFMLTEIHRQALGNPIIRLATAIREGRKPRMEWSIPQLEMLWRRNFDESRLSSYDSVIVGTNANRAGRNQQIRAQRGFEGELPQPRERLICLRNDSDKKIFNGQMFTVDSYVDRGGETIEILARPEGAATSANLYQVRREFFTGGADKLSYTELHGTQQFDFGYAITCHKAQGSQWERVCVFDDSFVFKEAADQWLYTAVTRASERLTLVM